MNGSGDEEGKSGETSESDVKMADSPASVDIGPELPPEFDAPAEEEKKEEEPAKTEEKPAATSDEKKEPVATAVSLDVVNQYIEYSKEEKTGQRINARYEDIISRAGGEYELITTVHELMQHTFAKYASKNCFGTRTYLGEHTPEGARFPLKMFGETTWKSYREVQHRAAAFGAGLIALGCKHQDAVTGGRLRTRLARPGEEPQSKAASRDTVGEPTRPAPRDAGRAPTSRRDAALDAR